MSRTLADQDTLPRLLRSRQKKRGIILLMVVSLLALFLLMGVTFAVLAIQYKYAADTSAQRLRYGDPVINEADLVLNQLLYESMTSTSISGHGLLRDMYGNDFVQYPAGFTPVNDTAYNVQILSANNQGGGQMLEIAFTTSFASAPTTGSVSTVPGYYNGRVLTIYASNIQQWVSTRIMQFVAATGGGNVARIYAETPVGDFGIQPSFQAGDPFVINGLPFNGTGAGFDPTGTANNMNAIEKAFGLPLALLPHFHAYEDKQGYNVGNTNSAAGFSMEYGGADEPYDIAGPQDMAFAFVPPRVVIDTANNPLIPSFHRPELLNFWLNHATNASGGGANLTYGSTAADPSTVNGRNLLRRMIFRPMPWDNEHPNFTGGNPKLDRNRNTAAQILQQYMAQQGGWVPCWDVDNDGDGITDSIWIDPGLPVMTAPNSRRYKRLAAILLKDLDSRANVNVQGNQAYAATTNSRALNPVVTSSTTTPAFLVAGQGSGASINMPHGFGVGPAEVDFCNILGGYGTAGTVYTNLLNSRYASQGESPQRPGQANTDDAFSAVKWLGMPSYTGDHTSELSLYSSPPDVWGRGAVAMDYFGQPAWYNMGTNETVDDPYEMQFDYQTAIYDSPFTPADQEHLSRFNDNNVAPSRLMGVAQSVLGTTTGQLNAQEHVRRESLTTMSYRVGGSRTFWRNDGRITNNTNQRVRQGLSVLDLYSQRLNLIPAAQFANQWRTIVPFEMMHGEAFNINRLFGNGGQDSTTYDNLPATANNPLNMRALIDDPSESTYGLEKIYSTYNFEHHNDDPNRPAVVSPETPPAGEYFPLNARITYARHLYCLLMLIKNNTGTNNIGVDADGDGAIGTPRDTARALAQFAVNVVDFRDNDSIHTGFEYDMQPFDATGWDVDGYLSTTNDAAAANNNRGVVWGVERPEMVITEAIALHDRRTEDLDAGAMGPPKETTVGDPNTPDNDYDARVRPKGRLFIELFNPWVDRSGNAYDHKPSELYYNNGVRLDATVADNRNPGTGTPGTSHPTWRILIVRPGPTYIDPDSPEPESLANSSPASVDRVVYFVDPTGLPATWPGEASRRFYSELPNGTTLAPVLPGRYAIVGSAGVPTGNSFTSYIGRKTGTTWDNMGNAGTNRRVVITPGSSTAVNQFQILNNTTPDVDMTLYNPVVGVPINMPRSLSVSEPIGGYESLGAAATNGSVWTAGTVADEPTVLGVVQGYYSPAIDTPLDKYLSTNAPTAAEQADAAKTLNDGTSTDFRTLYLQRLANPTVPWNRFMNPYITIDSSSVDLISFNGLVNDSTDPDNKPNTINFGTFQRGGSAGFTPAPPPMATKNLWAMERPHSAVTAGSAAEAPATHFFAYQIVHSLGFLNTQYAPGFTTSTAPHVAYVGAPTTAANSPAFPWLVHNNRPFMSPVELLHVSGKSPSQLLQGYTVGNGGATNGYVYNSAALNPDPLFSHVLNIFATNSAPGSFAGADGPLLVRMMDYIETPSPFVGAERYFNPAMFTSTASGGANVPTSTYRPPFGKLSRFRDPGRININTISEPFVWDALMDSYSWPLVNNGQTDATNVFLSRQGYANPSGTTTAWGGMNSNSPTIFANPFRPAEAADLMPVVINASTSTTIVDLRRREADATLLRRMGIPGFPPADQDRPLFAATAVGGTQPYSDPGRSPFMRYHPLQKIANNVSYNSNCFALWVTIGYFEVEENPGGADVAHPDGFRLGQELGLDEGNTQRHRAFYLLDRSIPVGFIPGVKLNSEDVVVLRRQID